MLFRRTRFNPVAPEPLSRLARHDVFEDSAMLLDDLDRADVLVPTRHQNASDAKLPPGDIERQAKHDGGIAALPELRHDDVADVPTFTSEKLIQAMPDRDSADNPRPGKGKQKRGWHVVGRQVDAL